VLPPTPPPPTAAIDGLETGTRRLEGGALQGCGTLLDVFSYSRKVSKNWLLSCKKVDKGGLGKSGLASLDSQGEYIGYSSEYGEVGIQISGKEKVSIEEGGETDLVYL